MRILYVIDKMVNLAGIERILTCKMNYLADNSSHEVFLVTYAQQDIPISFQLNDKIKYRPINAPIPQRKGFTVLRWIKSYFAARKVFKKQFSHLIKAVRPDLIICTGYAFSVLDIIINTSRQNGAKTIIESHVKSDTVSMKKYVYNPIIARIFSIWDRYIMKSLREADCIVTLTHNDKEFWIKYAKRVEVIPNILTIDPQKVIDYRNKRVIAAGRYVRQKGFDLLLEAWHLIDKRYEDWHLYIYGNEDRVPYQRIVDKYQMNSNVHLMPATKDIAQEFSKSSIFVLSSRFEGFGLVLAEAMSCGLPCISFDCPYGPRDIITNEEDGILVENGNIKVLTGAIERLMADDNLRQSMGVKAINNVARFNPKTIMSQWEQLFISLE